MTEKRKTNGHSRPEDFLLPQFEDVTLPSGLQARLRPPTLDLYILFGRLPSRVHDAAKAEREGSDVPEPMTREDRLAWAYNVICYTFIEPRFSTSGEPGAFHPSQLRSEDRAFIAEWSAKFEKRGGGAGLEKFRSGAGEPAGDGPSREEIRESSE